MFEIQVEQLRTVTGVHESKSELHIDKGCVTSTGSCAMRNYIMYGKNLMFFRKFVSVLRFQTPEH